MQGAFYNLTVQSGGTVTASLLSQTNTISGSINFTEYPGATPVHCGAGDFSGSTATQPFALSFVSQDTDPHCGYDWGAVVTMTANLDPAATHFWGNDGIKNAGHSLVVEATGVFELWAAGNAPPMRSYIGTFTNVSLGLSGIVSLDLVVGTKTVSGYIDFSNRPGEQTLCGVGQFSGVVRDKLEWSFVSQDPTPGCGVLHSKFLIEATQANGGSTISGTYRVGSQVGIFSAVTAQKLYLPITTK